MNRRVLITGATGNIGSQLTQKLAQRQDIDTIALIHTMSKATPIRQTKAKLIEGSYENEKSIRTALEGIDTLVLITSPNPDAYKQTLTVIKAARDQKVRKLVRISVAKSDVNGPTDNTRQHGKTDNEIMSSGLTHVILRPHYFMQNLLASMQTIVDEGKIYAGMGEGRLGMIDTRDIADCAERCVVSEDFNNKVLTLTGPESISYYDATDRLSKALGKKLEYVNLQQDTLSKMIRDMGMGEWFSQLMADYSKAYSSNWGNFTTDEVNHVTGHAPRNFDTFAREIFKPAFDSKRD